MAGKIKWDSPSKKKPGALPWDKKKFTPQHTAGMLNLFCFISFFKQTKNQVRKLAPLYAHLGYWVHAFNCLAMPIYKPDAHWTGHSTFALLSSFSIESL